MDKPLCSCHNEPMRWHKDPRRKRGGWWYCAVAERERNVTGKRRAEKAAWALSPRGRATRTAYRATPSGQRADRKRKLNDALRKRSERIDWIEKELSHT